MNATMCLPKTCPRAVLSWSGAAKFVAGDEIANVLVAHFFAQHQDVAQSFDRLANKRLAIIVLTGTGEHQAQIGRSADRLPLR